MSWEAKKCLCLRRKFIVPRRASNAGSGARHSDTVTQCIWQCAAVDAVVPCPMQSMTESLAFFLIRGASVAFNRRHFRAHGSATISLFRIRSLAVNRSPWKPPFGLTQCHDAMISFWMTRNGNDCRICDAVLLPAATPCVSVAIPALHAPWH